MIGSESDATLAARGSLPEIGDGCTRTVYMSNGIVYKVENGSEESKDANVTEYANAMSLSDVPAPFIVPPVYLHTNGVLSMPYYEGTLMGECCGDSDCDYPDCMPENIRVIANSIGADIPTWGNTIRLENGAYMLIDLGSIRS